MPSVEETPRVGLSSLPPLLRTFELWTAGFFLFSCCYHLFMYFVMHRAGHTVYPFSLNSHDRFYDFTIFTDKFRYFHTEQFFRTGFPINYPAPVAVVFEFFFKYCAPHSLFCFVTFTVAAFVVPAGMFARAMVRRGIGGGQAVVFVTVLCLLSWPIDLIVDGANAEVIVWVALLVAMWAYATGRAWLAAAFFGVAASLKLFPFVFLALFLNRRQMAKLLFGAATFFVVSIVSLQILGPTIPIAYRGIAVGLAFFKRNYMARFQSAENGVDHSIFSFMKFGLRGFFHHDSGDFTGWLAAYLVVTAVGGVLLYFLVIRKQPLLNQVLALSIACIYFTAFSGDGTLVHLYYPLGMLFLLAMQAHGDGVEIPGLKLILYAMVVTLSMESFVVRAGIRYIGPVHCVSLGVMLYAVLRYPMGPPLAGDRGETVLAHPVTGWVKRLRA